MILIGLLLAKPELSLDSLQPPFPNRKKLSYYYFSGEKYANTHYLKILIFTKRRRRRKAKIAVGSFVKIISLAQLGRPTLSS